MRKLTHRLVPPLLVGALFLVAAGPGSAQLQINTDGKAAIGYLAPFGYIQLYVASNTSSLTTLNYGTYSFASGTGFEYSLGLLGYGTSANQINYGVVGLAYFGGTTNYGIYGTAFGTTGSTDYAGYFAGDLAYTGSLISLSDAMFKRDVAPLAGQGVLERLMRLRPRSYTYKDNADVEAMHLPEGTQYGLIAQEVEAVFPELVHDNVHPGAIDEDGRPTGEMTEYKGIDYLKLVPLLLQALQEQQVQIQAHKAQIEALQAALRANGIDVN